MKIVQNCNVLSFTAFHSVNWLGFVVVCVGVFFVSFVWVFSCVCGFGHQQASSSLFYALIFSFNCVCLQMFTV